MTKPKDILRAVSERKLNSSYFTQRRKSRKKIGAAQVSLSRNTKLFELLELTIIAISAPINKESILVKVKV